MLKGQVWKVIAGFYDIKHEGKIYRVRARGLLRLKEISPTVGDIVNFEPGGFLDSVLPRRNSLVRPKVANVDQAIVMTSLKEPNYSHKLLNKFLAIIEFNQIKPIIVFSKIDLVDETPTKEFEKQGYEVFEISNETQEGIEELKSVFKNKLSVFTGQTGAGKSSTINSLAKLELKTQKISKALGRGKHTTRVVEIIDWQQGMLIDTPGFSALEFDFTKLELARSFKLFQELSINCKYRTCIHYKEPHCAVKEKYNEGIISEDRYNDYISMLKEVDSNEK